MITITRKPTHQEQQSIAPELSRGAQDKGIQQALDCRQGFRASGRQFMIKERATLFNRVNSTVSKCVTNCPQLIALKFNKRGSFFFSSFFFFVFFSFFFGGGLLFALLQQVPVLAVW